MLDIEKLEKDVNLYCKIQQLRHNTPIGWKIEGLNKRYNFRRKSFPGYKISDWDVRFVHDNIPTKTVTLIMESRQGELIDCFYLPELLAEKYNEIMKECIEDL